MKGCFPSKFHTCWAALVRTVLLVYAVEKHATYELPFILALSHPFARLSKLPSSHWVYITIHSLLRWQFGIQCHLVTFPIFLIVSLTAPFQLRGHCPATQARI